MFDLSKPYNGGNNNKNSSPTLSPGPRTSLLPTLNTQSSQPDFMAGMYNSDNTPPKINFFPAHTPSVAPQLPQGPNYLKAMNAATANSFLGGLALRTIIGDSYDPSRLAYEPKTIGEKVASGAGNLGTDLPLWMAGDALLAKPLGALAKTAPVAKAIDFLPKAITPALGTGIKAGATYGGVIAPAETALQGDGIQGLLQREKQVPAVALGGSLLHGAGQLIGKGVSEAGNSFLERKLSYPALESNPLKDVQNAYQSPSLRDAKAQQLTNTFADTKNNLGMTGPMLSKQGLDPTELLQQKQVDAISAFGRPLNNYKLSDIITPEQKARMIKQQELEQTFSQPLPQSQPKPLAPIGQTLPNQGMSESDISQQRLLNAQEAFGKPVKTNKYSYNGERRAFDALQQGIKGAQEFLGSNKLINEFSGDQFTKEAQFDNIKHYTGIDLPKLMADYEKAQMDLNPLNPGRLRLGKVAGLIPDLRPRDIPIRNIGQSDIIPQVESAVLNPRQGLQVHGELPKLNPMSESKPVLRPPLKPREITQPNIFDTAPRTLPEKPEPLQWTNKDNISKAELPYRSLANRESIAPKLPLTSAPSSNVPPTTNIEIPMGADGKPNFANAIQQPNRTMGASIESPNSLTGPLNAKSVAPELPINIMKNDRLTAKDIRQSYSSEYNSQRLNGAQIADKVKELAPKEQKALTFYTEAGGDKATLQKWASNPDPKLDPYRADIQNALNLSPEAQKAYNEIVKPYYDQAGQTAKDLGTIKDVRDNYINRVWTPRAKEDFIAKQNQLLAPGEQAKGRINNGPSSDLNPFTGHARARTYENIYQGIMAGEKPATLEAHDLMRVHAEELAKANTTRMLADSVVKNKIGALVPQGTQTGPGFTKVADFGGNALVMPEGIAKGLKAILEPDYIRKMDGFRRLQAYQGVVKSVDLSFSMFHHLTMGFQMVYQSALHPVQLVKSLSSLGESLRSGDLNSAEMDFVKHTGITSKVESNQDVMRKLTDVGILKKISENKIAGAPIRFTQWNNDLLFGKLQRYLKVMDYQNKVTNYLGKNPNINDLQLTMAKRGIAKEVNAAYGGLNWQALGVTKSVQSVMRLFLLAPDWTTSNVALLKYAGEKSTAGTAARQHLAGALLGGAIFTEGLNYLLSGHFTDKNAKGHEMEVEIQPGVYFSFFRGGIGDITKWASKMGTEGPLGGTAEFLQGKGSPISRTLIGLAANKDYYGRQIYNADKGPLQSTLDTGKFVASNLIPKPFGMDTVAQYAKSGKATPLGMIPSAMGLTRFSNTQDPSIYDNPQKAYTGNWLNDLISPKDRASDSLISKIGDQEKAQAGNSKLINEGLGKALATGGSTANIFKQYGVPVSKQKQLLNDARDKLEAKKLSPLAQKFQGLSKDGQTQFLKNLNPDERSTLMKEKPKLK